MSFMRGPELRTSSRYYYRVRVWDNQDEVSDWQTQFFEMGLLSHDEWKGVFIAPEDESAPDTSKARHLRCNFSATGEIVMARVYATALGPVPMNRSINLIKISHGD